MHARRAADGVSALAPARSFPNAQDYDLTIINHVEERDIGNYANPKYYWHYDNTDVAGWLKQADAEPDETKRNALYKQIQQQLADDAANLWVAAPNNLGILKKDFRATRSRASRRRSSSETRISPDSGRAPVLQVVIRSGLARCQPARGFGRWCSWSSTCCLATSRPSCSAPTPRRSR